MKVMLAALATAAALAGPAMAEKPTNVVPIEMYSFGYNPKPIVLRAGEPVTLVFTNRSNIGHEFMGESFFRASKILSGKVEEDGAVDLKGGQSASVTLIPARGTYKVHCGHPLHSFMGMHTKVYVQ